MRAAFFATAMLSCSVASAQVYKCPASYPTTEGYLAGTHPENKEQARTGVNRLTNAMMFFGELHGKGAMHGDIEEIKGGADIHFGFPDGTPRWLVCQYGGSKRVSGTATSGPQSVGGREWWMQLDPLVDVCDLKIREIKSRDRGESTWTATAICQGTVPPPPVMFK
jgi:hypothetical protein